MSTRIEDELRGAFQAAASTIELDHRAPDPFVAKQNPSSARRRSRMFLPAVAASATVAVAVPIVLAVGGASRPAQVEPLTVRGSVATVAGVSFPIPEGMEARILDRNSRIVVACFESKATDGCSSGVTVEVAVVNPESGRFAVLPEPVDRWGCQWVTRQDPQVLGGRHAFVISCSVTQYGPRSLHWYLMDGSLSIRTPADGSVAAQARAIAAGIDLTSWANKGGPPVLQQTTADPPR